MICLGEGEGREEDQETKEERRRKEGEEEAQQMTKPRNPKLPPLARVGTGRRSRGCGRGGETPDDCDWGRRSD